MKEYLEKQIRTLESETERAADDVNTTTRTYGRLQGRLDQARADLAYLLEAN